jgi:outer membrane protein assembly factor BamB
VTRRRATFAAALAALAVGAAVAWLWDARQPDELHGSTATEFEPGDEPGGRSRSEAHTSVSSWPTYRFDAKRTGYSPESRLRPPFARAWTAAAGSLVEFPPVLSEGRLFVATHEGRLLALDARNGRPAWTRNLGRCTASSPAVAGGVLYVALMYAPPCGVSDSRDGGFVLALRARDGRVLWRFRSGVTESSPLVVGGILYFGSWGGRLSALDAATGRLVWSYQTGDDIKASAAYADGTIYVGSYDGRLYALDARTGRRRWVAGVRPRLAAEGNFYATPAVAYGRVFVGATDGLVYAFGARSGRLLWATATRGYVYSSAALWKSSVIVGSYDGRLYALDAGTGRVRWTYAAGAPISGAPTVVAGLIYFSTCSACIRGEMRPGGRTFAVDARTGDPRWSFPDGEYAGLIADTRRAYLVGYTRIYGLDPRRP